MIVYPLDRIVVPANRQRRNFPPKSLNDLGESILYLGLLHPIVVRPMEDGTQELIAGERRLRAISRFGQSFRCDGIEVQAGSIPTVRLDELDPLMRKEAELHENIHRLDLDWKDKTRAEAEIHALRQAQNPAQTLEDTAKELAEIKGQSPGGARDSLQRSVLLAKHMHNPAVSDARSKNEAYGILTRSLEASFTKKLAEVTGKKTEHLLIQGDLLEEMQKLPREKFDCIIADPPYGIGADQFGEAGATHAYQDDREYAERLWAHIFIHGYDCTRPQAHLYLFCDIDHFSLIRDQLAPMGGWECQRTPIIWSKGARGNNPLPGIGFRRTYEILLFAFKGGKPAKGLTDDVLSFPPEKIDTHAAAKPVALYKALMDRSCIIGDSVLDPCCGSGTIFHAADDLGLKACGIEKDPTYAGIAGAKLYASEKI